MTSILIADFQFLTRKGIAALINALPGFQVAKSLGSEADLQSQVRAVNPDIVLMDLSLEKEHSFEEVLSLKAQGFSFLIISNKLTRQSVQKLLAAGIKGILTKNCSEEEIISGLKAVSLGNRFFCNNVLDLVVDDPSEEGDCEPTNLSPREYEVLTLITRGRTTAQIADELSLSIHTINSHRKNILKKLKLNSPTELVVYALESGLVKPQKT